MMKRYTLLLSFLISTVALGGQAGDSDKIVGVWKSPDNSYMIKIDKIGSHFQGRIVWLDAKGENQMKLDVNNPNKQLRNLPLKGNKVVDDLSFSSNESKWAGGTFYSFSEGKVYKCQISMPSSNQIKILKYIASPQEGETETWSRQN